MFLIIFIFYLINNNITHAPYHSMPAVFNAKTLKYNLNPFKVFKTSLFRRKLSDNWCCAQSSVVGLIFNSLRIMVGMPDARYFRIR